MINDLILTPNTSVKSLKSYLFFINLNLKYFAQHEILLVFHVGLFIL